MAVDELAATLDLLGVNEDHHNLMKQVIRVDYLLYPIHQQLVERIHTPTDDRIRGIAQIRR